MPSQVQLIVPAQPLRILPVIDLRQGQVVHGVAGRRDLYQPIASQFSRSSDPVAIAMAIRERLDLHEFYLADLDAIMGSKLQQECLERLIATGCKLHVDAGINQPESAAALLEAGAQSVIVGLETIASPADIAKICKVIPRDRLIFSLDLQAGQPVTQITQWQGKPEQIVDEVIQMGISNFILLDLQHVGTAQGLVTLNSVRVLKQRYRQHIRLMTGGGIRNVADLTAARSAGVHAVLIASALHSGQLTKADLLPFSH